MTGELEAIAKKVIKTMAKEFIHTFVDELLRPDPQPETGRYRCDDFIDVDSTVVEHPRRALTG